MGATPEAAPGYNLRAHAMSDPVAAVGATMAAVRAGVEAVVILDGRRPHAMLVELFSEYGAGTLVTAG